MNQARQQNNKTKTTVSGRDDIGQLVVGRSEEENVPQLGQFYF